MILQAFSANSILSSRLSIPTMSLTINFDVGATCFTKRCHDFPMVVSLRLKRKRVSFLKSLAECDRLQNCCPCCPHFLQRCHRFRHMDCHGCTDHDGVIFFLQSLVVSHPTSRWVARMDLSNEIDSIGYPYSIGSDGWSQCSQGVVRTDLSNESGFVDRNDSNASDDKSHWHRKRSFHIENAAVTVIPAFDLNTDDCCEHSHVHDWNTCHQCRRMDFLVAVVPLFPQFGHGIDDGRSLDTAGETVWVCEDGDARQRKVVVAVLLNGSGGGPRVQILLVPENSARLDP
jgi:hypothetical protein